MRTPLARFASFLRLDSSVRAPLMIQGVRHAWDVHVKGEAEPRWFERFLTPHFRSAFAGVEGCAPYAVASAEDVPAPLRSAQWRLLLERIGRYRDLDPLGRTTLLRALGALGLYRDVEKLAAADAAPAAKSWTDLQCHQALIEARARFILHEPKMTRGDVLAFLRIAEKAPSRSTARLEAAILFLSRALEKKLPSADIVRGDALARATLAALEAEFPAWEHARWKSKYWRCVSYRPYLEGRPDEARRQLSRAEEAARDCLRLTPKGSARFGLEDLYGVLTTQVLTEAKLGFPRRARPIIDELIKLDPEGAWQRLELGRVLAAEGDHRGAKAQFAECLRLGPPRRAEACDWLSRSCAELGDAEEARRWKEQAASLKGMECAQI